MKLSIAIEILEQDLKDQFNSPVFGLNVAKGLGIEALIFTKAWQEKEGLHRVALLRGQTEE